MTLLAFLGLHAESKGRTKRSQRLPDGSNGADEPNPKRLKSSEENPGPYTDRLAGFIPNEASAPVGVPLSWRLDPVTTFSDWTIVIEAEYGTSTAYHVHKCVLAAGQRKSNHFHNAFRASQQESLSSTSNISLDTLAAAAFPVMPDYIYEHVESQRLFFTVENAVALRSLANYFGVFSLFDDATLHIMRRLNFEDDNDLNVPPTFLKQAAFFRDETLISKAVDACAAVIQRIHSSDLISIGMPLLIKISTSSKLNCPSKAMGKIVAKFFHHYAGEMDWATLKALTREEIIPEIDPDV